MKMKYPSHLAIIMDGNRRWAKNRFLPAITGYIIGAKTAWKILYLYGVKHPISYFIFL